MDEIGAIRAMLNHLEGALECVERIENNVRLIQAAKDKQDTSISSDSTDSDDSESSDSVKCLNDDIEVVELSDGEQSSDSAPCIATPTRGKAGSAENLKIKPIQELTNANEPKKTHPIQPVKKSAVCSSYYKAFVFHLPAGCTIKSLGNWLCKKNFPDAVDIIIQSKIPFPVGVVSFSSKERRDAFLKMDSENFEENEVKVKVYIDEWSPVDDLLPENPDTSNKDRRNMHPKKKKKYTN